MQLQSRSTVLRVSCQGYYTVYDWEQKRLLGLRAEFRNRFQKRLRERHKPVGRQVHRDVLKIIRASRDLVMTPGCVAAHEAWRDMSKQNLHTIAGFWYYMYLNPQRLVTFWSSGWASAWRTRSEIPWTSD